jgi:hypothetical protein
MSAAAQSEPAAKRRPPQFKLRPPDPDEDTLHEAVRNLLDGILLPPTVWTCFPAGGYGLTMAAATRLSRLGLKPGWPDIQIIHDGRFFGLELKTRTGQLSKSRQVRTRWGGTRLVLGQVEMLRALEAAGARCAVCRSVDDVLFELKRWQIPTRVRL